MYVQRNQTPKTNTAKTVNFTRTRLNDYFCLSQSKLKIGVLVPSWQKWKQELNK